MIFALLACFSLGGLSGLAIGCVMFRQLGYHQRPQPKKSLEALQRQVVRRNKCLDPFKDLREALKSQWQRYPNQGDARP